jgi:hypothetical protein
MMFPKPTKRDRVARRVARRRVQAQDLLDIRAYCMIREMNTCAYFECNERATDLDHFWGRAKAKQSPTNCWVLCRKHHRMKTENYPTRFHWLVQFWAHAKANSYHRQAQLAVKAMERDLHKRLTGGMTPRRYAAIYRKLQKSDAVALKSRTGKRQ